MTTWPFLVILRGRGSVVEHCVSSAKGCGFDSQGTHVLIKNCITWMHCKSLWIKASAKCINVNVEPGATLPLTRCMRTTKYRNGRKKSCTSCDKEIFIITVPMRFGLRAFLRVCHSSHSCHSKEQSKWRRDKWALYCEFFISARARMIACFDEMIALHEWRDACWEIRDQLWSQHHWPPR